MSDSYIPWVGLEQRAPQPNDVQNAFQGGAAFGFDIGQKRAAVNALKGVDLSDPASVNAGMNASLKAGALDQANALMNLNWVRSLRAQLPALSSVFGGLGAPPGQAPQDTSAPNSGPSGPSGNSASNSASDSGTSAPAQSGQPQSTFVNHPDVHAVMQDAAAAIADIRSTQDPAQRQAKADAYRQIFASRQVPGQQLDDVFGPQGNGGDALSDAHLQTEAQTFGTYLAQAPPQTTGGAPGVNVSPQWALGLVNDPGRIAALEAYKGAGLDFTGLIDTARVLAAPTIQAQADIAKAGPIAAAQKQTELEYAPALAGVEVAKAGAVQRAQLEARLNLEPAVEGAVAEAKAKGTASGSVIHVQLKDGSDQPGVVDFDKDGNGHFIPLLNGSASGGGAGGAPIKGQTPGEKTAQTAQATQATELLKPDPPSLSQALVDQGNAQRALSLLSTIKLDPNTPWKAQLAQLARAVPGLANLPGIESYATATQAFEALANQSLASGARMAFPQRVTNRDIQLMQKVVPQLSTPNDQAAMYFGLQLAQAWRAQQWEKFKADYAGDKTSPAAISQAWQHGVGGQSVYQAPTWKNVTIGGKPAFDPSTDVRTIDGKQVGRWGAGLGQGRTIDFVVR